MFCFKCERITGIIGRRDIWGNDTGVLFPRGPGSDYSELGSRMGEGGWRCRTATWDGGRERVHKGLFHTTPGMVVRRQPICQPALHRLQRIFFLLHRVNYFFDTGYPRGKGCHGGWGGTVRARNVADAEALSCGNAHLNHLGPKRLSRTVARLLIMADPLISQSNLQKLCVGLYPRANHCKPR